MKKTDYKHGKFTILSSQIDTEVFDREDYIDFCEVNGIEPGDEDDFYEGADSSLHYQGIVQKGCREEVCRVRGA